MPPVKTGRTANVLDDILDLEAQMGQGTPPTSPQETPSAQAGPTGRSDTIKVNIDGIPDPIEFPAGTDPQTIQSTVQRLTAKPDGPSNNLPHLPEAMGAAGGMGGAQIGLASPVPGSTAIGAAAGATGGHFTGKTLQDMANGFEMSLERVADNALEATKFGLMGGAFEGMAAGPIGTAIGKGVDLVTSPFKAAGRKVGEWLFVPKQQSEVVKKSEQLLNEAGAPGLTGGQLSTDPSAKRFANVAENIAYGSLTSNVVNQIRGRQMQGLKDYASNLMERWGAMPPNEAADLFRWAVNDNFHSLYRKPMDIAMNDLRAAVPGGVVEATSLLRKLQSPNEKVAKQLKTMFEAEHASSPAVFDKLITLVTPVKGTNTKALPRLTLDEAMELKTALRELGDKKFSDAASQQMALSAKTMSGQVDGMIRQSLEGTPDLLRSYTSAMEQYGEGLRVFKNDLIQKFMKGIEQEPGALTTLIAKKGQVEFINNLKEAVGEQVWSSVVQPRIGATMLYKAFGKPNANGVLTEEGALSGQKLAAQLQTLSVDGTIQPIMGQKGYAQLLDLARVIDHVAKAPTGAGKVFIQLAQAGAIGAVVGGTVGAINPFSDNKGSSAGIGATLGIPISILLTPKILGHLVANPAYIDAFKSGLQQAASTGKAPARLVQLLNQIAGQETTKGLLAEPKAPSPETPMPKARLFPNRSVPTPSQSSTAAPDITPE